MSMDLSAIAASGLDVAQSRFEKAATGLATAGAFTPDTTPKPQPAWQPPAPSPRIRLRPIPSASASRQSPCSLPRTNSAPISGWFTSRTRCRSLR
ncbi:hypothetical protein SBA3_3910001 [Candidatus Sulfopaludibacter sp. SbA3]|nr:hypothetical protein SBA3_3910001 [Candidatus Sulfopaludibacter sp. SbA3]